MPASGELTAVAALAGLDGDNFPANLVSYACEQRGSSSYLGMSAAVEGFFDNS